MLQEPRSRTGRISVASVLIALLVIGLALWAVFRKPQAEEPAPQEPSPEEKIDYVSLGDMEATGFLSEATGYGGYLAFSPEGRYMFTYVRTSETANRPVLYDAKEKQAHALPESAFLGDWHADERLMVITDTAYVVYTLPSVTPALSLARDGELGVYSARFSPDGDKIALNTAEGVKLIDISARSITDLSGSQYDGAYAWFSDNERILGFRQTSEKIGEAGSARVLAIMDISEKQFTDVELPEAEAAKVKKTIRRVEWLKQDETARINTGFDDGSFDHVLLLDSGKVVDLGESSGMLMAMDTDQELGLFARVGTDYAAKPWKNVAQLFDSAGKILYQKTFAQGDAVDTQASYASADIVDDHTLLYARVMDEKTDLISLDFRSGQETVIRSVEARGGSIASPDGETYVFLSPETGFLAGPLSN